MYQLSDKAITHLNETPNSRMLVAMAMGVTEQAIIKGLSRNNGENIANHYDGFNKLIDLTGMATNDLRVKIEEPILNN